MDTLIEKFRGVALERVDRMDGLIVELESDAAIADEIVRELHTLKGESKMLGFSDINLVAHLAEDAVLDGVDDGDIELLSEALDVLRALLTKAAGKMARPIDLVGFVKRCHVGESQTEVAPRASQQTAALSLSVPVSTSSLRVEVPKVERVGELASEILLATRSLDHKQGVLYEQHRQLGSWLTDHLSVIPVRLQREVRSRWNDITTESSELCDAVRRLSAQAELIEDESRQLRHVRVGSAFQHYPRAVRDLSKQLGKVVEYTQDFGDVEVDRAIVSGLAEPLLHLIRNAVDHGIEVPEERRKSGKSEQGKLTLNARYSGSTIDIELRDDGGGIDPDKLRDTAVARGVLTKAQAERTNDHDAISLIFESGFSTNDTVSDVSGRGIGMDIVRRELDKLGGVIEVESELQKGTTFRLRVPITGLVGAIVSFRLGKQTLGVAARDIEQIAVVSPADLMTDDEQRAYVLHNEQRYLFYDWRSVFGQETRAPDSNMTLLLGTSYRNRYAFWVDEILDERTAITRPLDGFLEGLQTIDGIAMTETGETVPVLSIFGLMTLREGDIKPAVTRVRQTSQLSAIRKDQIQKTVLVVEDSEVTRNLVASTLRGHGFEVREAEDGAEALEVLEEQKFDLVVSDVQMPRMDGITMLKRIRSNPRFRMLPVVMLTTLGSDEDKLRAMNAGASAYLVKLNFRESELISSVKRLLS